MKKKIIALVLVLIVGLAVFASCGKKEEKTADMNFTVYNTSGVQIQYTIKCNKTGKFASGTVEDGGKQEAKLTCAVNDAGEPDLTVEAKTPDGSQTRTLNYKTDVITVTKTGSIDFTLPVN